MDLYIYVYVRSPFYSLRNNCFSPFQLRNSGKHVRFDLKCSFHRHPNFFLTHRSKEIGRILQSKQSSCTSIQGLTPSIDSLLPYYPTSFLSYSHRFTCKALKMHVHQIALWSRCWGRVNHPQSPPILSTRSLVEGFQWIIIKHHPFLRPCPRPQTICRQRNIMLNPCERSVIVA